VNRCLDGFDVERHTLSVLKLLDSFVHVADKLLAASEEFNGSVEGLAPIVVDTQRDNTLKELFVFWRKSRTHSISPTLMPSLKYTCP
jgi:hypothetical protein